MANEFGYWQRAAARRLGRRSLLQAGSVAGAAAFLAACGGGNSNNNSSKPSGQAPAASQAPSQSGAATAGPASSPGAAGSPAAAKIPTPGKLGGTLREGDNTQTPHFSPFHPGADPSFINQWRRVYGYYDHPVHFRSFATTPNPKDLLQLELLSGIEQPDDSTYIVHMQPSKFHNKPPANGRDVTSDDLVSTLQFISKPPATSSTLLQSGKDVKSMEAVDPLTVKFTLFGPRAFFYEQALVFSIVPKEMLDEQTLKQQSPVGSGPYMFKNAVQGSSEDMVANPAYRVKGEPYISERTFTFLPDSAAIEAAFRSGQIDTIGFTDKNQRDSVSKDLGNRIQNFDYPSTSGMAIMLNKNRPPWNDVRVREAFYRAVDINRILQNVFFGDGVPSWFFSPASVTRFPLKRDDPQLTPYLAYDPQKAQQLVKAAGWDSSKDLEIMGPQEALTWMQSAALISEDLGKIGIKTHVTPVIRNIYLQRGGTKPGDFDITMTVLLDYQYAKTDSGTFWNMTSLEDPQIDALVDQILQTPDLTQQQKLSQQFQVLLAQKYDVECALLTTNAHEAVYSYVKGTDPNYAPRNAWQEYRWLDK